MKTVLISIRPEWVEKITSGKKTIEVRKSAPKETPFKAYIYCSYGDMKTNYYLKGRGKVIGEFICDKVERFSVGSLRSDDIEKLACLSYYEMICYFYKPEELDGKTAKQGFAWHISDLKIYGKPKELSEFYRPCVSPNHNCEPCIRYGKPYTWDFDEKTGKIFCSRRVTRPPQSYMFVEEIEKR